MLDKMLLVAPYSLDVSSHTFWINVKIKQFYCHQSHVARTHLEKWLEQEHFIAFSYRKKKWELGAAKALDTRGIMVEPWLALPRGRMLHYRSKPCQNCCSGTPDTAQSTENFQCPTVCFQCPTVCFSQAGLSAWTYGWDISENKLLDI